MIRVRVWPQSGDAEVAIHDNGNSTHETIRLPDTPSRDFWIERGQRLEIFELDVPAPSMKPPRSVRPK